MHASLLALGYRSTLHIRQKRARAKETVALSVRYLLLHVPFGDGLANGRFRSDNADIALLPEPNKGIDESIF